MTDVHQVAASPGNAASPENDLAPVSALVNATETGEDWTVTQDRTPESAPIGGGRAPLRTLIGFGRRSWRGLTSMRTALILLFLLAIAAIPGSLLPQRNLNIEKVQSFYQQHPKLAPWLDRLSAFNVFASPWFSAIYLLLFISLVGCLLPRLRTHIAAMRRVPPDAPSRLDRMPVNAAGLAFDDAPEATAERLRMLLRGRRFRTVVRPGASGGYTVSGEKGYLKETGNLLFHFSLLALLIGVAFGSWYGWHADRLLVTGDDKAFCSTVTEFDDYGLGSRLGPGSLEPFCVTLDTFNASYLTDGQPIAYTADVRYSMGSSSTETPYTLKVNDPLRLPKANIYLLGHGYAPVLKYTDRYGKSQEQVFPFLPSDSQMTSTGGAMFPDVNVDPTTGSNVDPKTFVRQQVGFSGFFLPTVSTSDSSTPVSVFPAENDPMLVITPYEGDLGVDLGVSHSVYTLNQAQIDSGALKPVAPAPWRMRPGDTEKLPDGSSVQFVGVRQWVSLSVRYDPGEKLVLVGAICLVAGLLLSLTGRRRRVWFRVLPVASESGRTVSVASAGGLARAEYASFPVEFAAIVKVSGGVVASGTDSAVGSGPDGVPGDEESA